jgi:hypothetical protein
MQITMLAYIFNKSEIEVNINNISEKYVKNTMIVSWSQQHVSASDVYIFYT